MDAGRVEPERIARTTHIVLPARAYGTATWAPARSWSVFDLLISTVSAAAGVELEVARRRAQRARSGFGETIGETRLGEGANA
jgi:hypothetical protein